MADIDFSALFGLKPEAAVKYLEAKGIHIGWNWQDTLDEAHARSFTVAKMTDMALLADMRKAVIGAMGGGEGHRGFVRDIRPKMQAKGWWGRQTVTNPYGDEQEVQLGSPRRLATIYHTNRRAAVMAAQYQRMLEAADTHPYWQYWAILDGKTRPHHAAMHGVVYPIDDPFWQYNYPPNGYHCRCTVKALTRSKAEQYGIESSDIRPFTQEIGTDRSTGEIYKAIRHATPIPEPKGYAAHGRLKNAQFAADAGFNGSPAAGHLIDQMWFDKAAEAVGDTRALNLIARDMAAETRVRGFLAWVRVTQSMGFSQHRSYGIGLLSPRALKQFRTTLKTDTAAGPVVAYRDKIIAGKKARRYGVAGNDLDMAAYEKIVRNFGKPDYELWDTKNNHLLLVFNAGDGKAIKLAVAMYPEGAEVISGFYQDLSDILGAVSGGEFIRL